MTRLNLKNLAETLYLTQDIEFRTSSLTTSGQLNGHHESYEAATDAVAYRNEDMNMHLVEIINLNENTSRVDVTYFNRGDRVAASSYTTNADLLAAIRAFTAK